MATVLITGGTGLIGKALTKLLIENNYEVIVLTRNQRPETRNLPGVSFASWDISNQTIDRDAIQKADYIIHLAGAGVADKRWTDKRKKEIVDSRTQSSALIIKALKENSNNVKAIISASGIGWYGPDPAVVKEAFKESDPAYNDFLGQTCLQWEKSVEPVTEIGKRLVILRTGIVLSKEGGALAEFKKPIKAGVAGILGDGKQIISWIHIDDLCRLYLKGIEDEKFQGVCNAVAPQPVSNKVLTIKLAKNMRGNFYVPMHVPVFALKIVLGEMSVEVLKSATVSAEKIISAGYKFVYPSLSAALPTLM